MAGINKLIALVVEDHDFQRRTMARMLRSLGAREVREARDGRQALASISQAPVDLVVCDLNMPEMDGMEFMRHLGEARSEASVIIASAQDHALLSSVDRMARAYGVHLLGVIEKPVTLKGLEALAALRDDPRPQPPRPAAGTPRFSIEQIISGIAARQFEAHFQPKAALATGAILGSEALARWRHPEHGLVGPMAFIPVLEESRRIDPLTMWMLDHAARACLGWRDRGLDVTVSVNLSLVSLTDTMLADRVTETLRLAGLEPRHMVLEITESAAMTDVAHALENLNRLRMRGFGLSVDDYGTGFSSLQQLTRVPFSELKIDQGFVNGCAANPSSRTIVESSIAMARNLNMKSVAEGVETREDWDVLLAAGCDLAQGYFIAKPMPEGEFHAFCAAKAAT